MNSVNRVDLANLLFGMFADISCDIVIKTDPNGFVTQTASGLRELGIDCEDQLFLPHIADLADPKFATQVRSYVTSALSGYAKRDHIEFPLASAFDGSTRQMQAIRNQAKQRWFALRLRPTSNSEGAIDSGLAMLRLLAKHAARDGIDVEIGNVDPLTGLGNLHAIKTRLEAHIGEAQSGTLVLVELDSFRSLSHIYGPSLSEQMTCAFAEFLFVMMGSDCGLSRIGGARFAFISRQQVQARALEYASDLLTTFANLSAGLAGEGPKVSASAGLARIDGRASDIIAKAEKALILASTHGGSQAKIAEELPHYLARRKYGS